jgi:predicted DNA-binding transcriptional regulator YafY
MNSPRYSERMLTSREIRARKACQEMLQAMPTARLVDALVTLAAQLKPDAQAPALTSTVAVAVVEALNHAEQVLTVKQTARLMDALLVSGV